MTTVGDLVQWLSAIAPLSLSEAWDNTGLLVGDPALEVKRVMTCLTLTDPCVREAVEERADFVVTHHPLPFRPLSRLVTEDWTGRRLWMLVTHSIAVYSPHTAWDSAARGINAQLAALLGAEELRPLVPRNADELSELGAGRIGTLPQPVDFSTIARRLTDALPHARPRGVVTKRQIRQVAIACGSGGSLLDAAIAAHADMMVTGEATYHACLEAEAAGVGLLMVGHYASERFAMENLASWMREHFAGLTVWAARSEADPVQELRYR
ncbi:MAG: GTP cyclohydrolase 1 type 2 [Pirellulaceae bacterium]|nr:MAG: GTP cyclohydrolase 1 type 2 [Pirellulaceae bacterium]